MARHPAFEFSGHVTGGRLDPAVALLVGNAVRRFDGNKVLLTLREWTRKRSIAQNAYWFGVLEKYAVPAFRETGHPWSQFTIHEYVMNELGYQEVLVAPDGKLFVSRMHSSDFDTRKWEVFMEEGRAFLAVRHGVHLPLPHEEL